jgi:sugar lactone lactonase YvrE
MATVAFKITLPARTSAIRRAPRYVSASTQSASIGVAAGTASPSPATVVNCTTVCTAQIQAPVGSDTFAVTLYDMQNAAGNKLALGSLTQTIVANQVNVVNVALEGVVAGLAVVLNPNVIPAGSSATVGVTVNALDAGNNIIIGPGLAVDASGNPVTVTLTDSDTSGATVLSQTSFQVPVSGITLSYNGSTIPNPTISAIAPGLDIVHALLTIGGASPYLFVGNGIEPGYGIVGFPQPLTAASTPNLSIPLMSYPTALLLDNYGTLYATNHDVNSVTIYPSPLTSGETPSVTITSGISGPYGLGIDNGGNLYVGNNLSGTVTIYAPPFTNSSAPVTTIRNGINALGGITVDFSGNLYVSSFQIMTNTVTVYTPPFSNSSSPSVTISGLSGPGGLAADPSGNLYVVNSAGVSIFNPPITNTSTPSVTLINGRNFANTVALDPRGNLYVTYPSAGQTAIFTPPFMRASTPSVIITNGLQDPISVALPRPGG